MWARRREEKVGQRRNSTITPLCRPSSRTTHTHTHLSVIVSSERRARRSTTSVRLPPCRPFIEAASSASPPTTCSLLLAALAEHDDADRCDAQEKHGFRHSPVRLPSAKLKEICSSLRPPGSAALSETRVCSSSARHRRRVLRRTDQIGSSCSAPQLRHAAPGISFWRALWAEREADRGEHPELSPGDQPLKKSDS